MRTRMAANNDRSNGNDNDEDVIIWYYWYLQQIKTMLFFTKIIITTIVKTSIKVMRLMKASVGERNYSVNHIFDTPLTFPLLFYVLLMLRWLSSSVSKVLYYEQLSPCIDGYLGLSIWLYRVSLFACMYPSLFTLLLNVCGAEFIFARFISFVCPVFRLFVMHLFIFPFCRATQLRVLVLSWFIEVRVCVFSFF